MIVYAIAVTDSDGCTYSCEDIFQVFAKLEDAETELTKIELIQLEAKEHYEKNTSYEGYFAWQNTLNDYFQFSFYRPYNDVYIREIEVIE